MNAGKPFFSRVVFWDPSVSPHKADLSREFARAVPSWEVINVADQPIAQERAALGWTVELGPGYEPIVAPSDEDIMRIVAERPNETLHVFSGIRWVPTLVKAIREVRAVGARFAIMSEPRATEGWRGIVRVVHSWLTEGWFRRNCEFVLAIGRNGPPWFRLAGYPVERLFPFAYFIPAPSPDAGSARRDVRELRIGFIGRLVREKGVFDLARACAGLRVPYKLVFVGGGAESDQLREECSRLHVDARFAGVVPINGVKQVLRDLDVLVLASHSKDGWGVVVSEALLAGCAVVTTPEVGASILVRDPRVGRLVPSKSPYSIRDALEAIYRDGGVVPAERKARSDYAMELLTGRVGAAYLLEIVGWCEGRNARPRSLLESPLGIA